MKIKKLASLLLIFVIAIFMLTMVFATVEAVNAASKVKVTWDANGGKIGNMKTTVTTYKNGAKVGKLLTPKKSGYTFGGWYTKKSGGTKITATTKVKKKVTYYAHWKKNTNANAKIDSKLIGTWRKITSFSSALCTFTDKGRFIYNPSSTSYSNSGNYKVSDGKIFLTNVVTRYGGNGLEEKYPNTVVEYKIVKESNGDYLLHMPVIDYRDKNYLPISYSFYWHKTSQ